MERKFLGQSQRHLIRGFELLAIRVQERKPLETTTPEWEKYSTRVVMGRGADSGNQLVPEPAKFPSRCRR